MGWYADRVLPHVIHLACGSENAGEIRRVVVPPASGRVLELGIGSGLNVPFYDARRVEVVWGVEPATGMLAKARRAVDETDVDVRLLEASAEDLPLDDDSIDTVVVTWSLCSIVRWHDALAEVRRVLRPGGVLRFAEHGLAPDASVRRWQHRVDPVWTVLAGGCHLDRPILDGLAATGFAIESVESAESDYRGLPRSASFTTWGTARPR